ncbi:MAG: glycosyltransferase family 4 protein [Planctomycetes bacterium]|nr:glycosyltransferase family 4 protein [Planctomycetota bacterium]
MRIVHLSTLHAPLDVRIFYKECRTLARAGHDVQLLVNNPPAPERDGVHFHALAPATSSFRPLRIRRRLNDALAKALDLKADVYHVHDAEILSIARHLKRDGAKVIYDVHEDSPQEVLDMNPGRPIYRTAKYFAFKRLWATAPRVVDHFVAATPAIAAMFPPGLTTTVCNFPLSEEFSGAAPANRLSDSPDAPRRFIFIGGISAIRGAREMVQAMSLMPQEANARLLLVGEFQPPELHSELARLPGWSRVDVLPWQPREKLGELLAGSIAGLVPFHPGRNHTEALPNKIFEYMAAGLPVIASDFPLWRGLIAADNAGLLIDPLKPASIADALSALLTDPARAAAMGRAGAALVRTRYNWEAESAKLVDLYATLRPRR